jgi:hypothetical protein
MRYEYMKKLVLAASVVLLMSSNADAYKLRKKIGSQQTTLKIYGFSQLEVRGGDGIIHDDQDAIVKFGAQRIRFGVNYSAGHVRGKLFLDFNQAHTDKSGVGLPDMVKDAFATYFIDNRFAIKFGLIKTPMGMGFTIPGWMLDVVERGFDKQLVFERDVGLMISGRGIGYEGNEVNGFEMGHERPWRGFGYDIMIANQAGRSAAVVNAQPGNDNAYIGRIMWDWTELFHTELSYGISKQAGGIGTQDYKALNFGIDSHLGEGDLKLEIFRTENIRGVAGWDENTYSVTGSYYIDPQIELVLKHIHGDAQKDGISTKLGNTFFGIGYYLSPFDTKMSRSAQRKRNAHRIQFNYVVASGDTDGAKVWNGLEGYKDDVWLLQYQYKF